ncbi:hypothetical protein, partial [Citrobacter portucalensis]|uniref:hypothetical protein n=1 Tax=Citrobacter portucalensis TaxID=1639133 RepID=UPI0023B054B6
TPRQNPQGQKRHTVTRYARPTPLRRAFRLFFLAGSKKRERCFKGVGRATLPASGRRLSGDGVRGKPPK